MVRSDGCGCSLGRGTVRARLSYRRLMSGITCQVTGMPKGMIVATAMGGDDAAGDFRDSGVQGELIVDQGGPVVREGRTWPAYPLRGTVEAVRGDLAGAGPVARADSDARG